MFMCDSADESEYGDNKATSKNRAQGDQIASAAGNQKS